MVIDAGVVKLVDAGDSKSPGAWLRVGSSPTSGTIFPYNSTACVVLAQVQVFSPRGGRLVKEESCVETEKPTRADRFFHEPETRLGWRPTTLLSIARPTARNDIRPGRRAAARPRIYMIARQLSGF